MSLYGALASNCFRITTKVSVSFCLLTSSIFHILGNNQYENYMHLSSKELTILYNKENERDRKTLSYAHTITQKINKQELNSVRISGTLFQVFVNTLEKDPKKLINKADPYYQKNIRGRNFSVNAWFKMLRKHPNLLKAPLAMYENKAVVCNTPTDILKLA